VSRSNKNDGDIKVICKFFVKENSPGSKCNFPGSYCCNIRLHHYCDESFYIGWIDFIKYKYRLIEVK